MPEFSKNETPAQTETLRRNLQKYADMVLQTSVSTRGSRRWSRNVFRRSETPGKRKKNGKVAGRSGLSAQPAQLAQSRRTHREIWTFPDVFDPLAAYK